MTATIPFRKLLEDIKSLTDARHAQESPKNPKRMILHPPAREDQIEELLGNTLDKPLPPSYGEFLRASDGVENGWDKLNFLSTDKTRQKSLRNAINYVLKNEKESFEAIYDDFDDKAIVEWESKPERAYLANHTIVAASQTGHVLFYDMRTRDRKGQMELCWKPAHSAVIEKRFPNIRHYFESILAAAKNKTAGT